jgi:microcompartment protein CcmL/EutN
MYLNPDNSIAGHIARPRHDAEIDLKAGIRAAAQGDATMASLLVDRAREAVSRMPPGELLPVEQREIEGKLKRIEAEISVAEREREQEVAKLESEYARTTEERAAVQVNYRLSLTRTCVFHPSMAW